MSTTVAAIAILAYMLGHYGLSLRTFVSIILPGTVIATSSIVGLSLFIIRPLKKLTEHADSISKGVLTLDELNISRRDEIGALAVSFNRMTDVLKYKSDLLQLIAKVTFPWRLSRCGRAPNMFQREGCGDPR